ncbi:hypothetical protein J6590_001453 [Homalodisca vitripennis]|nr:hypothetical protein J6590_001453 [Homalodisca vitripennis]
MWSFFSRDVSKDFQYEILDKSACLSDDVIWTLHKAKKKMAAQPMTSSRGSIMATKGHVTLDVDVEHGDITE